MPALRRSQLEQERAEYRANIAQAIEEDEDPLAAYDDFIGRVVRVLTQPQLWSCPIVGGGHTKIQRRCALYGDFRYLKIWCSYAKVVEKASVVYAYLVKREIGCVYAQLWEECTISLEEGGRYVTKNE